MEDYIQVALRQYFIQPSTSPAASSFFFVGKKDGGLRPCIDYRTLNSQTVKLPYPFPLVPAALEELRGAHIFSKLDLRSAYNLICIREGDEWKPAFITPSGHYEYKVMPYGLSNSPSIFQSFMNEVFREFLHRFVIVYIDDILLYSWNLAEHRHHVTKVLQWLTQHRLYLKQEKCEFHHSTACSLHCSPPSCEVSPSPCPGTPMPTKPKRISRKRSARPPSCVIPTRKDLSWWKWTLQPPESGPCCPNSSASLLASTLAHISPRNCPQRR